MEWLLGVLHVTIMLCVFVHSGCTISLTYTRFCRESKDALVKDFLNVFADLTQIVAPKVVSFAVEEKNFCYSELMRSVNYLEIQIISLVLDYKDLLARWWSLVTKEDNSLMRSISQKKHFC